MSKKILLAVLAAAVFVAVTKPPAHAQLFTYTTTTTTPSSSVVMAGSTTTPTSSATTTSSPTSTIASTSTASTSSMTSSNASAAMVASGYIQIDDLTVTDIASSSSLPTEIFAADLSYPTIAESGSVVATTTATVSCQQFATDSSPTGIPESCPVPFIAPTSAIATTTMSSTYYSPYTLIVNPTTQLLLSGRAPAVLGNVTPGDVINVYGYFDAANDTIDAEIIRDLSKPAGPAPMTTEPASTTAIAIATSTTAITELQTYVNQLETLIAQLQSEIASGTISPSSTTTTSAPMIPATTY